MRHYSSLLPFETLIDYLSCHGFADNLDSIMQIKVSSSGGALRSQRLPVLSDEYREKFMNTWWEVCWPFPKATPSNPPQCLYLADSLRDALRLRPNIDTTFWSNKSESFAEYLKQTEEWLEEAEEFEFAE
jgi:hypothetical protein